MPDENKQLFHNFVAAFHPCNISRRIRRNPGIYGPSIHQLVNALESIDGHCPCAFTRWLWNLPDYMFDDIVNKLQLSEEHILPYTPLFYHDDRRRYFEAVSYLAHRCVLQGDLRVFRGRLVDSFDILHAVYNLAWLTDNNDEVDLENPLCYVYHETPLDAIQADLDGLEALVDKLKQEHAQSFTEDSLQDSSLHIESSSDASRYTDSELEQTGWDKGPESVVDLDLSDTDSFVHVAYPSSSDDDVEYVSL